MRASLGEESGRPQRRGRERGSRRFLAVVLAFGALNLVGLIWVSRGGKEPPAAQRPRVQSVWPRGEVGPRQTITVTFTQPVASAEPARRADPARLLRLEPPVPGVARWGAPDQLIFQPAADLPRGRELQIVLAPEIGWPGPPLEGSARFSFTVEPLELREAVQARLDRDLQATLRLVFNDDVPPARLRPHLKLLNDAGTELPCSILDSEPAPAIEVRTEAGGDRLRVVFAAAPPGVQGLGTVAPSTHEVRLSYRLDVTEARGSRVSLGAPELTVYFTNPIDADQGRRAAPGGSAPDGASPPASRLADFFELEPAVPFEAAIQWSSVVLKGAFQPGAFVRVRVKRGLRGVEGTVLAEDAVRDVYFPEREPSIAFGAEGIFISSRGNLGVVLQTVNIAAVNVRVLKVHANNLVHALAAGWPQSNFVRALPPRRYDLPPGANQVRELVLDLRDLLGPEPRGVWYLEATGLGDQEEGADTARKLITVSDIGLVTRDSPDGRLAVWAVSLRTGLPLRGAQISLRSVSNQLIAEGRTGSNGVAFFDGLPGLDGPPHVVLAETQDDSTFLDLGARHVSTADLDIAGRPYPGPRLEALAFVDRGVYRPGDTVRLRAIVRGAGGSVPGQFPVEVETLRPNGKRLHIEVARLDVEGTLESSLELSPSAATGLYRVRLRLPGGGADNELGSLTFRVEEYMPQRVRAELALDDAVGGVQRLRTAETARLVVRGSHFFGGAAAGARVEARARLQARALAPREWRGFRFGELESQLDRTALEPFAGVLDEAGEVRWELALPPAQTSWPLELHLEAEVSDVGGRPVHTALAVPVDPCPHYLGLRPEDPAGPQAGAPARFECVAVRADGSLAALAAADLTVWRVRWSSLLRKGDDGRYRYESRHELEEISRGRVQLSSGRGAFEIALPAAGGYRLRLRDPASSAAAELAVHVRGEGDESVASLERPEHLELSFARAAYRPGESARLVLPIPFAGSLLLTVESSTIESARVFQVKPGIFETDLSIPADCGTTLYAAAVLVRGLDLDGTPRAQRAHGLAPIPIDLHARRLQLTVHAPREVRPESSLRLRVQVAAEDGEPVPDAAVTVYAVDEGLLALTRHRSPDPFAFFYAKRAHRVELSDTFVALLGEVPLSRPRDRPGGDARPAAPEPEPRLSPVASRRVRSTSIWLGTLAADENGLASGELALPPFTGELRIVAVATAGARCGAAETSMAVRGPLFFEMSLPRFAAPGDAFSVPVTVFRRGATPGTASLAWTLDGLSEGLAPPAPGVVFASVPERSLELPAGGYARAVFGLRAENRVGEASARLSISLGDERHAEAIRLPVRPAAPRMVRLENGTVAEGKPLRLAPRASYLPGTSSYRLTLGPFPGIELAGSLRHLLLYPHGCLEQTISRAFPLLYLGDLALLLGDGDAAGQEKRVASDIASAIERLVEMQTAGGGLGTWPGSRHAWPWASVYGAHFLLEARAAGHPVPEAALGGLLRYLTEEIVRAPTGASAERQLERAYALQTLARAGTPDLPAMDRLRDELLGRQAGTPRLPPAPGGASARFLLASAYLGSRNDAPPGLDPARLEESVRDLLGSDLPAVDAARDTGAALRSPARETAILLATLLEADPESPRVGQCLELLRSLRLDGRWESTQENAFALLALGKYARRQAHAPSRCRATVRSGGRTLAELGPGDSRSITGSAIEEAIDVDASGDGVLHYTWVEEGVPADGRVEERDVGLRVRRQYLDRQRQPLDPGAVPLGATVLVEIVLEASAAVDNVVVTDLLPAGLEVDNPRLEGGAAAREQLLLPEHFTLRDDRAIFYVRLPAAGISRLIYVARAVTRGTFALPPVSAEAMYDARLVSVSGAGALIVR